MEGAPKGRMAPTALPCCCTTAARRKVVDWDKVEAAVKAEEKEEKVEGDQVGMG